MNKPEINYSQPVYDAAYQAMVAAFPDMTPEQAHDHAMAHAVKVAEHAPDVATIDPRAVLLAELTTALVAPGGMHKGTQESIGQFRSRVTYARAEAIHIIRLAEAFDWEAGE